MNLVIDGLTTERLDSLPAFAGYEEMLVMELPKLCQHCAHWEEESEDIPGWKFCMRLWSEEESDGQVGETGPRFGCVHWRAGE